MADSPPVEHFDYDDLEDDGSQCDCRLCRDYRERLEESNFYAAITARHKRDCKCRTCSEKNAKQISYMAAVSKRDTYSELSFLVDRRIQETEHARKAGHAFLAWVYGLMLNEWKSEGWWAIKSPNISLQEWIDRWQEVHLPRELWAVSGIY